ncbi:MAG TPA: sugar ABC transporter permease [Chloroflexota bacterium]
MRVAKRASAVPVRRVSGLRAAEMRLGIVFMLPSLLIIGAIVVYPLLETLRLSFTDRDFLKPTSGQFVGFENYLWLLQQDRFWLALRNSVVLTVSAVVAEVVLAIGIGLLLNRSFRGRALVRGTFILPWVIPAFVAAFAWRWMLDPTFGVVNQALQALGLIGVGIPFLSHPGLALPTVIVAHIWKGLPWVLLVVLAGLQLIPHEVQEAARIDGASAWQEFWHITLPHLKFVITVVVVLRTIWTFNWFDLTYLLAGGSRVTNTIILPIEVYQQGFTAFKLGRASAVAGVMMVVLVIFMFFFLRLMAREGEG